MPSARRWTIKPLGLSTAYPVLVPGAVTSLPWIIVCTCRFSGHTLAALFLRVQVNLRISPTTLIGATRTAAAYRLPPTRLDKSNWTGATNYLKPCVHPVACREPRPRAYPRSSERNHVGKVFQLPCLTNDHVFGGAISCASSSLAIVRHHDSTAPERCSRPLLPALHGGLRQSGPPGKPNSVQTTLGAQRAGITKPRFCPNTSARARLRSPHRAAYRRCLATLAQFRR